MGVPEPSVVGSEGGFTDLSKRTDRTSYSIPDDGRSVTIQTDRRQRRKRDSRDDGSVLSHGTNTSLLIEYFENAKGGSGTSGRQPSVRVKVTPSAARRHRVNQSADGNGVEISEVGSGDKRRPTHTHRIQLAPHTGEDRLTLGQVPPPRSYSGDQSTLSSITSGGDDSNFERGPVNVTVIREAGSPRSILSPRDVDAERRRRRRTASRNRASDSHFGAEVKNSKHSRSRSVSRESDIYEERPPGLRGGGLGRRKSRSLSRERINMSNRTDKERIEQAVRDELARVQNPKEQKESLKPPRDRSRSRSRDGIIDEIAAEKARARRKAAQIEGDDGSAISRTNGTDRALVELIRGTIRELLLPEIEEMKAKQQKSAALQVPGATLERGLSIKGPGRASSMPDVGKPKVVLSPDADKSPGLGMVIAGDDKETDKATEEEILQRAPGFGLPQSPLHSESGEGVSLVGALPAIGDERVHMPDAPFRADSPGTYAETRASILTAKSGLPYPMKPTGMPKSGTTPPPNAPKSELFPELSELNLSGSEIGGASSLLSDPSATGQTHVTKAGAAGPSIASLIDPSEINHHDDDDGRASVSSLNHNKDMEGTGYSEVSLQDMSVAGTSVLAKERKEEKNRRQNDAASATSSSRAMNEFLAERRERQQEQALLNPGGFQDMSQEVYHVSTATAYSEQQPRRLAKDVDTGHQVFDLGANPSMRSTPVLAAHSAVASVLEPSNVGSALSYNNRPNSRPQLSANAMPIPGDPMPDFVHDIEEDDDEINTNPSIIQGPIGHHTHSWEMAANDFGVNLSDRGLNVDLGGDMRQPSISPRPISGLASPRAGDEGYISAANPMGSPGSASPIHGARGDAGMRALDDMLSDPDFYHSSQRNRMASGNSHGMPSPLYDSATGRGMDRIESKDIVALMEHLTVRDAQRNARDTEILVTLVRSAAEMRNSFEDMKRALAEQRQGIVSDVDQNTERSVQKLIQGPRPPPPSAPRRPRYSKSDEDREVEEEGRAKRASVFKRALKGLSMGSSKDLERIEEMLCRLLGEVEGLKDGQQLYQHSLLHSQSIGTIDQMRSAQEPNEAGPSAAAVNSTVPNGNFTNAGAPRQPSSKGFDHHQGTHISPIQEDSVMNSPREARVDSLPFDAPPEPKIPAVNSKSSEKHAKRESGSSSLFPRISRWSETTASTGLGKIFKGKNNQDGSEASRSQPDFNFWETEAAKGTQADLHQSPFDSDGQRTERAGSPISLDIQHPRPRMTYNHQLEQQAQQLAAEGGGFLPSSSLNGSVSSLGNYPPLGPGGFQNGKLLSPLAQDAYAQHQAQLNGTAAPPPRPPKVAEDGASLDGDSSSTRKHRKHRERDENGEKIRKPKKERTEEEKQRRRERKEQKKKSRELLSDEGPSISGRTPSTASRLNGPRPLSSASNKERRHRHQTSQATNETFGNGGTDHDSPAGAYR